MNQDNLRRAAEAMWRTRREESRIDHLPPELRPTTLAEGYDIQDAMVAVAAQPVYGWKIAATSAAGQKHIGVTEPLAGRLFKDFVLPDGAHRPAKNMHMRVAEAEFAFKMAKSLPARGRDYTVDEVCDAVAGMYLAIEIPDARFQVFDTIGAPAIAADDAFADWFILGREVQNWRSIDLPNHPVHGKKNGTVVSEGKGANALGDPRLALTWLANHLAKRNTPLEAGHVITTGTCLKPVDIRAGDTVVADFGALGTVTAHFD